MQLVTEQQHESDSTALSPALSVRLANTIGWRRKAWRFVYDHYRAEGFADYREGGLWYGHHDLLPTTRTFLVLSQESVLGTMTQLFDSDELGLPADALFKKELDELRRGGSLLTEATSFVSKPDEAGTVSV